MRVGVYTRLSKDRAGESENVQIQERECRDYAEERGWQIVNVFSDNDIGASRYSKKDRPDYRMLLESIRAGQVDAVLCTEMPRLYRRLPELLVLIELAETTPLQRIETTDGNGFDLSTGIGRHNAVSAVNTADFEAAKISERTKHKKKAQATEGRYGGGPVCYGYHWTPATKDRTGRVLEPGHLDVDPAQARVIRDACRWLLAGNSLRGIARRLNTEGYRTTTGAMWRPLNLRRILLSHRIIGVRTHNGVEYPGIWEPIIDRDTWERVRAVLTAPARMVGANRKGARTYLLTGYAVCGRCGHQMIGRSHLNPTDTEPKRRYDCPAADDRGVQTGCGRLARQAEPVEVLVAEAVLTALDSPEMAGRLDASAGDDGEMAGLLDEHAKRKQKLTELVDDYADGLLTRPELARARERVDAAIVELQQRMTKLTSNRTLASVEPGQTFRQAWAQADLDWRRALVATVVDRVVLHPGRPGAHRWSPSADDPRSWNFDHSKVEIRWKV
jgi:DNA invertase Pin-like site-specific DNA recombinase